MSDVNTLLEMGFPLNRVEKALSATKNQGVQLAMDWLFAHADDPAIDEPIKTSSGCILAQETADDEEMVREDKEKESDEAAETKGQPGQALSLKCEDCGKLMKSEAQVQVHAGRTGHQNFAETTEEIKPLTEEEKKLQMEKLQAKMAEKRQENLLKEKQENIDREKMRRKTGKELTEYKQKFEMQEAQKIAEQRRREKLEARKLREKLREQIAQDRAEKSSQSTPTTSTQPFSPPVSSAQCRIPKEYTSCRLQFRLTNGEAIIGIFEPTDTLSSVVSYISSKRTDGVAPFSLSMTFPRKTFSDSEMRKTLKECGLVPSAVLILTKQ